MERQRVRVGDVEVGCGVAGIGLGVVVARGDSGVRGSLDEAIARAIGDARARGESSALRARVRDMLRHGTYKPTGRGKPASEYLLRAALDSAFPRVFPRVDAANLVSLAHELPISLVDLAKADARAFTVRRGRAGEAYTFNAAGQTIDLEDLLLLAALPADVALANPVKDSLATKLDAASTEVLGVIYAPAGAPLDAATRALAGALTSLGGAAEAFSAALPPV